jgi:hypothetical protein
MKILRLYFVGVMLSYSMGGTAQTTPAPSGKLVYIGGCRLHLKCAGEGPAAILLKYRSSGNSMHSTSDQILWLPSHASRELFPSIYCRH